MSGRARAEWTLFGAANDRAAGDVRYHPSVPRWRE